MMAKNKRRTKAQKIISQLRRELEKQQQRPEEKIESKAKLVKKKSQKFLIPNYQPSSRAQVEGLPITQNLYIYNQSLVKKDLFKTFLLSLIFFSLIGIFYWYFQTGGEETMLAIFTPLR